MEKTSQTNSGFWGKHKSHIQVISAILGFFFFTIPGCINAVTGKPFEEWLKEHGMNMPFITIVFWGVGIGISVFIFFHERTLIKESGYKFSILPWIYVFGFTIFMLLNGFYNPNNPAQTPARYLLVTNTVSLTATNFVIATNFVAAPKNHKIPDVDTNQEAKFSGGAKYDNGVMATTGRDAFLAGNYAYCIIFLKQSESNDPNGSWQANRLFLAAARLAQNSTSEGYQQFHATLDDFVGIVRHNLTKQNTQWILFCNPANFAEIYFNLGKIQERLPESEAGYIEKTIGSLKEIQKSTEN